MEPSLSPIVMWNTSVERDVRRGGPRTEEEIEHIYVIPDS